MHPPTCPFPYYGNAPAEVARWMASRVVECVGCGASVPEPIACWHMAEPVCHECWRATFAEGVTL